MVQKLIIRELVTLPSFYFPSVSWARDKVAFYWDITGRIELYILDVDSQEISQISHGELPKSMRTAPIWSRDNHYLLVTKDRDGDEQHDIFAFDTRTGDFFAVTQSQRQNYPVEMSPDNTELLFASTRNGQMNLFILSWDTKEVRQITTFSQPVGGGTWSPDGKWIYFSANESEDLRNKDIYRIQPDASKLEKFWSLSDGSREIVSEVSPDGRFLGATSDFLGVLQPGIINLATGEVLWLGDGVHEEYVPRFSPDGRWVLTTINADAALSPRLYCPDSEGVSKASEPALPTGVVGSGKFLREGKVFFIHGDPTHRPRMLYYSIHNKTYLVLQDAEYGSINQEDLATAEYVSYQSFDGMEIYGILWRPGNTSPRAKVPVVILIHGGPGGQDFLTFDLYAQVLCSLGFAVFQPNYRSSMGYGKEFYEANRYDWGGGDLQDIVYAAQYLKTVPWIDGERIVVAGGSYGGYLTYMAMVKAPEVWCAGIARVGITDLHKFYESQMPHFKHLLRYFMGDPEENRELWRNRSPITHAANLKAPLLIVHGVTDPRCPIEQARIFRDKLLELGFKEGERFEYVELTEEGHGSIDQEQKIRIFELLANFLERRVLNR